MPQVQRFQDLPDVERKELWASLALRHCKGLGARTCKSLLKTYGSAFDALQQKTHWGKIGIKPQVIQFATTEAWREHARIEWNALVRCNPQVLMWHCEAYPAHLREIADPPILLYGEGDFSLLASPCFAIVGSRKASEHGLRVTRHLASRLAACGIAVVAGMARGIDSAAHLAAVAEVGRSVGVLGTGIDICYPEENTELFALMRTKGLLLTEFAPQTKPLANNFPIRNRLISGLCLGVLIVEASEKSGSLITARLALEQNREVYVVPGPAMNAHFTGCQRLVREGAHPVFTADDIVRDLVPQLQNFGLDVSAISLDQREELEPSTEISASLATPFTNKSQSPCHKKAHPQVEIQAIQELQPAQQKIVQFLLKQGVCHVERLAQELDMPIHSLNAQLMELELAGFLKRLPGAHFALEGGLA